MNNTLINLGGNAYINPAFIVEIVDGEVELLNGHMWFLNDNQVDNLLSQINVL